MAVIAALLSVSQFGATHGHAAGSVPLVGAVVAQRDEVGVHLLRRAPLLARFAGLAHQPARQLARKPVQLARPVAQLESWLDRAGPQIFADRVPRQTCPPRDLPNGHPVPERPAPDDAQ